MLHSRKMHPRQPRMGQGQGGVKGHRHLRRFERTIQGIGALTHRHDKVGEIGRGLFRVRRRKRWIELDGLLEQLPRLQMRFRCSP